MLSCLFIAALWASAGKGLISWLACVWCLHVFCHFLILCPGSGVVLDCVDFWTLPSYLLLLFCQSTWPRGYKFVPCSFQLSTKFILLINVKMPSLVGILTFMSMINTSSERLNAINFFICRYFSFYKQLKFRAQLSWAWNIFYTLGACLPISRVKKVRLIIHNTNHKSMCL